MGHFPDFMKQIARKPDFYKGADRLLHVQRADEIRDPVFDSALQKRFNHHLSAGLALIPGAESAKPARLATGVPVGRPTTGFRQFSTVGPLLEIHRRQNRLARQHPPAGNPILIATDVVVERFEVEPANGQAGTPAHARVLHTSRGPLTLRRGKTNVILATGPIPNTTILLNSLGETFGNTGKRLTAHFRSGIKARFKPTRRWLGQGSLLQDGTDPDAGKSLPKEPAISACHVRGRVNENGLQWHIQVNGSYEPVGYQTQAGSDQEKAELSSRLFAGLAPDNGDTLTPEQAANTEGYIIVCMLHFIRFFSMTV